jgi:uncharacterized protein (TIGR03067 family)
MDGPEAKGKCTVDTGKSPPQMDMALEASPGVEAGAVLGIYRLAGDRLELCLARDMRPTDFTSQPGSIRTLFVLKKQRP